MIYSIKRLVFQDRADKAFRPALLNICLRQKLKGFIISRYAAFIRKALNIINPAGYNINALQCMGQPFFLRPIPPAVYKS